MKTRIVEIGGVKLEVDMRYAKKVENFKIGDGIKVLIKAYSNYESNPGVIIGFDNFEKLPTIRVAYLKVEYNTASIKFLDINSETKDVEICPISDYDVPYSKTTVLEKFDAEISKVEENLRELKSKREYFMNMFGQYFDIVPTAPPAQVDDTLPF